MKDFSADDPRDKFEDGHSSTDDYLSKKEPAALRARLATAAALTLLPLVFFYPAVKGAIILAPGDGWSQNLGVRILIGEMIRNGQLPL